MIGAMWNGFIGLNVFDKAIAVESNNVSNTTTVGNKLDSVSFEDMFYSQNGIGNGVAMETVSKIFTQGELEITNVTTDAAIEGKGFFVVEDRNTNEIFYSRAGNFQKSGDSFLETQEGMLVKGLSPQDRQVISTDPNVTMFSNDYSKYLIAIDVKQNDTLYNINIKTTDYTQTAVDDDISLSGNNYKTASSKIVDVEALNVDLVEKLKLFQSNPDVPSIPSTTQITQVDFSSNLNLLNTENDYLTLVVDGTTYRQNFTGDLDETLNLLSDQISNAEALSSTIDTTTGIITIEGLIPGDSFTLIDANINDQFLLVNNVQEATLGSGLAMVESSKQAFINAVERADAEYLEITNVLTNEPMEQLTLENIQLNLDQLGLVDNSFGDLQIDRDGYVYLVDGNSKFLVSKLQTAGFTNEQGLEPNGSNIFSATKDSGEPFNADSLNTIAPNFLERANTSYSSSLSTLLVYQKAFEANSKSVTISDEFLKTAIDMKK